MTVNDTEKLEIVAKKVEQLARLYEIASQKDFTLGGSQKDTLVLIRFTMSLERQIRQLQEDVKWILGGQVGPRPEVIGGKRK